MILATVTPEVCSLEAIRSAAQPRHKELIERLRTAILTRSHLPDGYTYKLETRKITPPEVDEWIVMERLKAILGQAFREPRD